MGQTTLVIVLPLVNWYVCLFFHLSCYCLPLLLLQHLPQWSWTQTPGFMTQEMGEMGWAKWWLALFGPWYVYLITTYITFTVSKSSTTITNAKTRFYDAGNGGDGMGQTTLVVIWTLVCFFFFLMYHITYLYFFCRVFHNDHRHKHWVFTMKEKKREIKCWPNN